MVVEKTLRQVPASADASLTVRFEEQELARDHEEEGRGQARPGLAGEVSCPWLWDHSVEVEGQERMGLAKRDAWWCQHEVEEVAGSVWALMGQG